MAFKIASAAPADQVHVEMGWSGGKGKIKKAYYGTFPYKNKAGVSTPAAALILEIAHIDDRENSKTKGQMILETNPYSIGSKLKPCDKNGNPVGQGSYAGADDMTGFPDNCNASILFQHLQSVGIDEDKLRKAPIDFLNDTEFVWKQVEQPDRDFGDKKEQKEGQAKAKKHLLVPAELLGGSGSSSSAASGGDEVDEETLKALLDQAIVAIVEAKGGTAKKVTITLELPKVLDGEDYKEHKGKLKEMFNALGKGTFDGDGYAFDGKAFTKS